MGRAGWVLGFASVATFLAACQVVGEISDADVATPGPGCVEKACPRPETACVSPVCVNGACGLVNSIVGLSCDDHDGRVCDGTGKCVGCLKDGDCPPTSSECAQPACGADRRCTTSNVKSGTAFSLQAFGDCVRLVCDGKGGVSSVPDNADTFDDADACTIDTCQGGKRVHTPVACAAPEKCDPATGKCAAPE
jgi:hypothetical protein